MGLERWFTPLYCLSHTYSKRVAENVRRYLLSLEEELITPKGYGFTAKFHYPPTLINIIEVITILFLVVLVTLSEFGVFLPLQRGALDIVTIITIIFPFFVRRMIQRGVSRLLGYPVTWSSIFSIRIIYYMADFSVVEGEYRSYGDALLVALAPLSLYVVLLIPLLFGHWGVLGNMLAFILLACVLPTISDLYFACWLLTKPKTSVLYMIRRRAWLFEPLSAEQRAQEEVEAHIPEQPRRRRHRKAHHH